MEGRGGQTSCEFKASLVYKVPVQQGLLHRETNEKPAAAPAAAPAALGIIENRLTARFRNLHLKLSCISNSTVKIYNPVLLYMDGFKKI